MMRVGLVGILVATGCTIDPTPSWDGQAEGVESAPPSVYTAEDGEVEEPVAAGDDADDVFESGDTEDAPLIEFTQTATTWWSATSIAVGPRGEEGLMGMEGGGACVILPDDGDLGDEEDVHDCPDEPIAYFANGNALVGGIGCDDLAIYAGNGRVMTVEANGLVAADAMGDQFVSVQTGDDGCSVSIREGRHTVEAIAVDSALCESPSLVTDAATGEIFVAAGSLWAIADGKSHLLADDAGDLLALDRASGTLVTAFAGGTQISGFAVDGAELWSQATEGPVARLHEVGDVGAVMAHLENNPSDVGRFVAYGSADGSVWGESIAWPQIRDLDVSADGSTMVVSTGTSTVYSYGIRLAD